MHRIVYPIQIILAFSNYLTYIPMLIFSKKEKNEVIFQNKINHNHYWNELHDLILGSVIVIWVKYRNRCPYLCHIDYVFLYHSIIIYNEKKIAIFRFGKNTKLSWNKLSLLEHGDVNGRNLRRHNHGCVSVSLSMRVISIHI